MGSGRSLRHRALPGRRRLHLRRGDGDLQLDRGLPRRAPQQAAVPGRGRPVRQADARQQRRDPRQRAAHPRARAARPTRRSAPRARPAPSCSASRAASCGPACTRCRSASRCAELLAMAGGVPDGRSLRAVLLGGAAGGFVRPDELDAAAHVRGDAGGGRLARLGRGDGARRHRRPGAVPAPHRRPSSATSRAGSACRAGSAPSGRRRRCTVWPRNGQRSRRRPRAPGRPRPGHARRVDLRPRPDGVQRDRVGHRSAGGVLMSERPACGAAAPAGRADRRRRVRAGAGGRDPAGRLPRPGLARSRRSATATP